MDEESQMVPSSISLRLHQCLLPKGQKGSHKRIFLILDLT
jgi:hypothetical protein